MKEQIFHFTNKAITTENLDSDFRLCEKTVF